MGRVAGRYQWIPVASSDTSVANVNEQQVKVADPGDPPFA